MALLWQVGERRSASLMPASCARFCAAEALSLLPQDDPRIKRARLSVAQGYGFGMTTDDEAETPADAVEAQGPHSVWLDAFTREPADLYSHPAILAAALLLLYRWKHRLVPLAVVALGAVVGVLLLGRGL